MALREVRSYRTSGGISPENNFHIQTLSERGPSGGPVLRLSTTNSDTGGAGSGMPNRRNDGQIGLVELQAVRSNRCFFRVIATPPNIMRWLVPGPYEIHGQGLPQAPVMPSIGKYSDGLWLEIDANGGGGNPDHRYFKLRKVKLGEWLALQFTVFYTNNTTGWWRVEINGSVAAEVSGERTTDEVRNGYWKYANYGAAGNWSMGGAMTYDTSDGHILDGDPGRGSWVLPGGTPDPVPVPVPVPAPVNTKPTIEVLSPKSTTVLVAGQKVQVTYKVNDDSAVAKAWIGYIGSGGNNVFVPLTNVERNVEKTLELPAPLLVDVGKIVHFYAACEDDRGLAATPVAYPLNVSVAPNPVPMTKEEALLRLTQASNRLSTVESWTVLTVEQRQSAIDARTAVNDVRVKFFGATA